jgi:hypothetical protein
MERPRIRPRLAPLSDEVLPPVEVTDEERMVYPLPVLDAIALFIAVAALLPVVPVPTFALTMTDPAAILFICMVFSQGSEDTLLKEAGMTIV